MPTVRLFLFFLNAACASSVSVCKDNYDLVHILFFLAFSFVKVCSSKSDSVETTGGSQCSQDGGDDGHHQLQNSFPIRVPHDIILSFD